MDDIFHTTGPACILLSVAVGIAGCTPGADEHSPTDTNTASQLVGSVERLDDRMDGLVSIDARFEVLSDGHDWTEGPLWVPGDGGYVLFSDIPPNTIFRWDADNGPRPYLIPSGYTGQAPRGGEVGSNGLLLDDEGRLVLCQHGDRRLARMNAPLESPRPEFVTIADRFDGKRLNSPNDAVLHSSGALYFTDPPYGLEHGEADPARELDFQGVFRRDHDGTVSLMTDELSRPNGIAFSPDETILYVANSDPDHAVWMAYDVKQDGTIANGRIFFDATPRVREGLPGLPDGLRVDEDGNLFATGPGGVLVFSPDGSHLGTLNTTQATSNCAFGDDGASLFVTADRYLLRIKLLAPRSP